jgi:hypothetical protein
MSAAARAVTARHWNKGTLGSHLLRQLDATDHAVARGVDLLAHL